MEKNLSLSPADAWVLSTRRHCSNFSYFVPYLKKKKMEVATLVWKVTVLPQSRSDYKEL